MRRLAVELGAAPMAAYSHFRDKRELLAAVVDAVMAQVELPEVDGRWRKPIRRLADSLRRALLAHPAVMPAVNVYAAGGVPATSAVVDRAHGILRGAGFADEQAVAAVGTLYAFTLGAVSLELARASADPAARGGEDRFRDGLDRIVAGIAAAGRAPAT
jgi:AcrR family transcriptional regulator